MSVLDNMHIYLRAYPQNSVKYAELLSDPPLKSISDICSFFPDTESESTEFSSQGIVYPV